MNTQAVQVANTPTRSTLSPAAEDIKVKRDSYVSDNAAEEATSNKTNSIQPEELLNNIKALTEDGLYSVRFEVNQDTNDLIINLVDNEGEVIRQIPPEDIVEMHEHMIDLRGNIVDTES